MKKANFPKLFFLVLSLVFFVSFGFSIKNGSYKVKLSEKYRKFLDEVSPIITKEEKEIFLSLKTDKERDEFIKIFWAQRDPLPLTPENEYKEEYYRRLKYVNSRFGREEGTKGWKTERGRVYLLLGPPKFIDRYDGMGRLYPTEVWFYSISPKYGLPSNFYLVFFKPPGSSGYRLYSPNFDGPSALIGGFSGDPTDYYTAYEYIKNWEPELAPVTISLIPEKKVESVNEPPQENIALLSALNRIPYEMVDENYAERYFSLKPFVDVDYTTKYVEAKGALFIFPSSEEEVRYINVAIAPERFSIERYKGKYYTKLQTILKIVSTYSKKEILNLKEEHFLNFSEDIIQELQRRKVFLMFKFPVGKIGKAKVIFFVKNIASNEYFILEDERDFGVKGIDGEISDMLLSKRVKEIRGVEPFKRPFFYLNRIFYPLIENEIYLKNSAELSVFGFVRGKSTIKLFLEDKEILRKELKNGPFYINYKLLNDGKIVGFKKIKAVLFKNDIPISLKEMRVNFSPLFLYRSPLYISVLSKRGKDEDMELIGEQYERIGLMNFAKKLFKHSLMLGNNKAACELVKMFYKKKQYKKAEVYLDKCRSERDEFKLLKGMVYVALERYVDAAKICNDLRLIKKDDPQILKFCNYLYKKKKWKKEKLKLN